ncbi:MAG TPA: hypothetical protein VGJ44_08195 [Kribbellaceae bacterium]|jgi:hypothetical protein
METQAIHLHARVFHREGPPGAAWYVDIDDLDDQQPDDPFWYGWFGSQRAAVDAACRLLDHLAHDPLLDQHLARISERSLATAS